MKGLITVLIAFGIYDRGVVDYCHLVHEHVFIVVYSTSFKLPHNFTSLQYGVSTKSTDYILLLRAADGIVIEMDYIRSFSYKNIVRKVKNKKSKILYTMVHG